MMCGHRAPRAGAPAEMLPSRLAWSVSAVCSCEISFCAGLAALAPQRGARNVSVCGKEDGHPMLADLRAGYDGADRWLIGEAKQGRRCCS